MSTPCYLNIVYGPNADEEIGDVDATLNAIIPTTGQPRLRMEPVYAEDGVQIAYYEYTLTVDTVIYSLNQIDDNLETEITRLREILGTPGLKLAMHPVGLGEFPVINEDSASMDVMGGPFPQEVMVESIASNKAIYVKWVVVTRIKHCPDISGNSTLIQFISELDLETDDEGDLTFNYRFTYQLKDPITNMNAFNTFSDILTRAVGKSFQGMRRKKRLSFSKDQRIAKIHIQFQDIKSDNAFFPATNNIEVTDEMSSNLFSNSAVDGQAFYSWNRKISGTITLPPRIPKGWAWVVFLKILRSRFSNLSLSTKLAAILDATQPTGQEDEEEDATTNYYLPYKITITNPLYTRAMKFSVEYMVVTDLANLIEGTKIFKRVETSWEDCPEESTPLPLSDQWQIWDTAHNVAVNGNFNYNVTGFPIIYNQCEDYTVGSRSLHANSLLQNEYDPDYPGLDGTSSFSDECDQGYGTDEAAYPDRMGLHGELGSTTPEGKVSWIDYKNDFEIIENTNNLQVSFLQNPGSTYYQSSEVQAATASRSNTAMTVDGKTSDPASFIPIKSLTIARGVSRYQIRMKGYALRAGHKIPTPSLVNFAGSAVSRTGTPRIQHTQIARGEAPVYLAMWDIVYNVDRDIHTADVLTSIKTSGVAGHYT